MGPGQDCLAQVTQPQGVPVGLEVQRNQLVSRPQSVTIQKVLNGYFINVGCQTVVFETREKMLFEVNRYLENPAQVEKEYMEVKR